MRDDEQRQARERGFRALLCRSRRRAIQPGVERLLRAGQRLADREQAPADEAFDVVYRRERGRVIERLLGQRSSSSAAARRRRRVLLEASIPQVIGEEGPDFQCDAALGGLAGWLRAAGYDAAFWPGIDDDELLRKSQGTHAIMLTTDRRLMERGVVRWGVIAARLISNRLTKSEQFVELARRLSLPIRSPRCTACGGQLAQVDKESVKARIPPKTYPWLDDYYACRRCGRLFWQGTHWERIGAVLNQARAIGASSE